MGTQLGYGYSRPVPKGVVEALVEPSLEQLILAALLDLKDAIQPVQVPVPTPVIVEPDLTAIVTAVTGLKQQATPNEIAEAIVSRLTPTTPAPSTSDATLAKVADALVMLEHRLQGISYQAYGGGAVSLNAGQTIGISGAIPETAGTYAYDAGSSGTVTPANGAKVRGLACHATTAATVSIKAGASIPVPANTTFFDSPEQLVGDGVWTITFTGTDNYYVRYL